MVIKIAKKTKKKTKKLEKVEEKVEEQTIVAETTAEFQDEMDQTKSKTDIFEEIDDEQVLKEIDEIDEANEYLEKVDQEDKSNGAEIAQAISSRPTDRVSSNQPHNGNIRLPRIKNSLDKADQELNLIMENLNDVTRSINKSVKSGEVITDNLNKYMAEVGQRELIYELANIISSQTSTLNTIKGNIENIRFSSHRTFTLVEDIVEELGIDEDDEYDN